jgi:transcriptional regulator with XRE-family HTH domain
MATRDSRDDRKREHGKEGESAMDRWSKFATRLKELREAAGWSQGDLGDMLGVARNTISGYENGKRRPDGEKLATLSEVLDADMGYLMGLTNDRGRAGRRIVLADYLPQFPPDLRELLTEDGFAAYVVVARGAYEAGLDADALAKVIEAFRESLSRPRNRDDKEEKDG